MERKKQKQKQNELHGSFFNLMIKVQKLIDHSVNIYNNIHNITATLSALWVSRNLGGFSLPPIYLAQRLKHYVSTLYQTSSIFRRANHQP
jgi:hypothetical protein